MTDDLYTHKITCDLAEMNALLGVISGHCSFTDSVFIILGSSREGTYSSIRLNTNFNGEVMRDLIEAHVTGDYEYDLDPWRIIA